MTRNAFPLRYYKAMVVSIAAHVMGALILLFVYFPSRTKDSSGSSAVDPSKSTRSETVASTRATPPPMPPAAPDVPAEQMEASISSQIQQVQSLSDERKLSELEKNLKRLDQVAQPESVRDVTTTIASTLGLDDRTYQPKEPAADGPFDHSTAQIQDVMRVKSEAGDWSYESVLVDAEGRTANVPMNATDGATTYDTFQQMKKFPMAEGIYRSIVMPMLQKMLEAEEFVNRPQPPTGQAEEQAGSK